MVYSKKEREQYNIDRVRTCERLGIRELDYNAFRRIGQSLQKIYVMNCNGEFKNENEYEEATSDYYKSGDNLAKRLNLYIFYQTDPRGGTIYLSKEPIPENDYTTANVVY
jgi:hypothetical protein